MFFVSIEEAFIQDFFYFLAKFQAGNFANTKFSDFCRILLTILKAKFLYPPPHCGRFACRSKFPLKNFLKKSFLKKWMKKE